MTTDKLQLPTSYAALSENEMSCIEGGRSISEILYVFSRSIYKKRQSKTQEQKEEIFPACDYPGYPDGYKPPRTSISDYFHGLSMLFKVFVL